MEKLWLRDKPWSRQSKSLRMSVGLLTMTGGFSAYVLANNPGTKSQPYQLVISGQLKNGGHHLDFEAGVDTACHHFLDGTSVVDLSSDLVTYKPGDKNSVRGRVVKSVLKSSGINCHQAEGQIYSDTPTINSAAGVIEESIDSVAGEVSDHGNLNTGKNFYQQIDRALSHGVEVLHLPTLHNL